MCGLGSGHDEIAGEVSRRCWVRPREAYRLAWRWTLDQAAARFNDRAAREGADPQARASMTGPHLNEMERWPRSARRPSVYVLCLLAQVYETDVLRLLDLADHESLPAQDRLVLLRRPRTAEIVARDADSAPDKQRYQAAGHPMASQERPKQPGIAGADHPLRRARRCRGMTLAVLADLAGLSLSFLSMVENGHRSLSRRDDVNALAAALRVSPADLAPSTTPGADEWAPQLQGLPSAFPGSCDTVTVARHEHLAGELMTRIVCGDTRAAGVLLRRGARDPGLNPWLLLDLVTAGVAAAREPGPPGRRRAAEVRGNRRRTVQSRGMP
jgi:transcriptional regulator with XRE-family HTH domain